jgi:hypothetical protein
MLLARVQTEYNNRRMYGRSLKKLQRLIQRFRQVKSPCFAKTYHNAQMFRKLQSALDDYRRYLYLIQQAYFSSSYIDTRKVRESCSSIDSCSTNIGRVIHTFPHSSHATICQDRIRQKPRPGHRSARIYQYQFCGCFKNSSALHIRSTERWSRFCML